MKLPFGWELNLSRRFGLDARPSMGNDPDDDDRNGGPRTDDERWQLFQKMMTIERDRERRYAIYRLMDNSDVVGMVADQLAEDASPIISGTTQRIRFNSGNKKIADALDLMRVNLEMDANSYSICREIALMGDDFERLVYARGRGVLGLLYQDCGDVSRVEDKFNKLVGYQQKQKKFKGEKKDATSYPWDFIHYRNLGKYRASKYGTSLFNNGIRPWKQLVMAVDEQLFYRINRRYSKDIHKIWTGSNDPVEQERYVKKYRDRYREQHTLNPQTKQFNHQYIPPSPSDDIFLGHGEEENPSDIIRVPGDVLAGTIDDMEYYLDMYFASVRMPKEMFIPIKNSTIDFDKKKKLTSQNLVYARMVDRLQKCKMSGDRDLAEIHLTLLAEDPDDTSLDYRLPGNEFEIEMEPVSYLAEYERLDLLNLRYAVAGAAGAVAPTAENVDTYAWTRWIFENILQFKEYDLDKYTKEAEMNAENSGMAMEARRLRSADKVNLDEKIKIVERITADPKVQEAMKIVVMTRKGREAVERRPLDLSESKKIKSEDLKDDIEERFLITEGSLDVARDPMSIGEELSKGARLAMSAARKK